MKNILIFILLTSMLFSRAQTKTTFFEVSEKQNVYFENQFKNFKSKSKEEQKTINKAYKKYIRWHTFWHNRIDKNGFYDNYKKELYKNTSVSKLQSRNTNIENNFSNVDWNIIGPTNYPGGLDQIGLIGMGRITAIVVDPNNRNHVYIGAMAGGIWETYNLNGANTNWTCLTNNIPIGTVSDLKISNNTLFATSSDSNAISGGVGNFGLGVIKKGLNETEWTVSNEKFSSGKLAFSNKNTNIIYAIGTKRVYKSYNFGDSWVQLSSPFPTIEDSHFLLSDIEINPNNDNKVIISGRNSRWVGTSNQYNTLVFKTEDGGDSWHNLTDDVETLINDEITNISSPETLVNLQLLHSNGGRVNNISLSMHKGTIYIGLKTFNEMNYFIKLDNNWNILTLINTYGSNSFGYRTDSMIHIFKVLDNNTIIVGARKLYLIKNDIHQINRLDPNYSVLHQDIRSIDYNKETGRLLVGTDGDINVSYDSNNNFNFNSFSNISGNLNLFLSFNMSYININGNRTVRIGNQDTGYYRSDNTGNGWNGWNRSGPFGEGRIFADHQDPNIVYYFRGRSVKKSLNGGSSTNYTNVYIGDYGISPFEINPNNSNEIVFDNRTHWSKYHLSITRDKLASHHDISNGNNDLKFGINLAVKISKSNSSVCYLARKTNLLSAAGINNKIFKSTNIDANYSSIAFTDISNNLRNLDNQILDNAYITDIEVDDFNENNIWISFGNLEEGKKVYHSTNGGITWENISGNLPNVPANVMQYDAINNNLYLGTDYGVYFYDSKSRLWSRYGNNLPIAVITELEIDNDVKEIIASTHGRSVWVSKLQNCRNYVVNTNEVWSRDRNICGDLIINSDKQLTIYGSNIKVNNIILKKGASLIVNDGSNIISNYYNSMNEDFNTNIIVNYKAVFNLEHSNIYNFDIDIKSKGGINLSGNNNLTHSKINVYSNGIFRQYSNSNISLNDESSKINLFENYILENISIFQNTSRIDEIDFSGNGSVNVLHSNTISIQNETLNNGKYNFDADYHIQTSDFNVNQNATVNLKAGKSILLNPNTNIKSRSFKAFIDSPDLTIYNRQDDVNEVTDILIENSKESLETDSAYEIKVFPNPIQDLLNIQCEKEFQWYIYTSTGNVYLKGHNSEVINTSSFPKGVYLFKAIFNNENITLKKIMKN